MLTRIEALDYRCLRHVEQSLGPFHLLVGPNSSGKTTFLDVVSFLRQALGDGPEAAVEQRASRFEDLVWAGAGERFELAVEARIPEPLRSELEATRYETARYELRLQWEPEAGRAGIAQERLMLRKPPPEPAQQELELDDLPAVPETIFAARQRGLTRTVVRKKRDKHDNYYSEITPEPGQGWFAARRLGPWRSALGHLPDDERAFPVASWLRAMLVEQTWELGLRALGAHAPCPPLRGRRLRPDGSNLAWAVADLETRHPERAWLERVRAALPDVESVRAVEREDDRHAYLVIRYQGGLEQPSWATPAGTLRMLALSLLEHVPGAPGIHLLDLPESLLHPDAARVVFESLRSPGRGQVLATTHSPELVGMAAPDEILSFSRTSARGTIVRSSALPPT
jgi:predicted ATPase